MALLSLKDAVAARNALTAEQQKHITELYENWAKQMHQQAVKMDFKGGSAAFAQYNARYLEAQMKAYGAQVAKEIQTGVAQNVFTVSNAVIDAGSQWLQKYGFSDDMVRQAFGSIPHETVQRLVTGQVYESGWSLSKAIWSDNMKAQKDAYEIVAKGLAMNKPVYDIAKELEAYVSPSQRLSWSTATYNGQKIRIYKKAVDYNAQRLARTLTQHSYMQSFTAFAKRNPFATGVMWRANGARACPICSDRDGIVFAPGKVPLDHPNGMCDLEIVYDEEDMQNKLADWVLSEDGKYPEIDKFAESMGFKPADTYKALKTAEDKSNWMVKNKLGGQTDVVPPSGNKWANTLPKETQMELKQLKAQMSMTWDDFYAQFVFKGTPEEYLAGNPKATGKLFKKLKPKAVPKQAQKAVSHEKFIDDLASKMGGKEYIVNYMDVTSTVGWDWGTTYEKELYELIKSVAKDKGMTSFDFWEKYVQGKAKSDKIDDAIAKFFKLQKPTAQAPTPTKSGYRYAMDSLGKTSYSTTNTLYADVEKQFGKSALADFKKVLHEVKGEGSYSYHIDAWNAYKKMTMPKAMRSKIDDVFTKYGPKAEERAAKLQAEKDKALKDAKKKAEELKQKLKQGGVQSNAPETSKWQKMLEGNTRDWMRQNEQTNMALMTKVEQSAVTTYTGSSYSWMNAMFESFPVEEFESPARLGKYLDSIKHKTFEVETRYGTERRKAEKVVDCYKGLEKCVVEEPLVVRRGTGKGEIAMLFDDYAKYEDASAAAKQMSLEEMQQKFVGQVGINRQFESCSPITSGGFSGSAELVFYLNPGCEGSVAWTGLSSHSSELEFLLNSGHKVICRAIESGGGQGASVRAYIEVLPK